MNMTLTPARNSREETRKETNKIQPSVVDHITHDIVNQLSVISLCCCELRNSVAEKLESDQLKEFKRIESPSRTPPICSNSLRPLYKITTLRVPIEAWNPP
jgi:hypothetical protein